MKEYYARRAAEYDATSWDACDPGVRTKVERFVATLLAVRTVDIGCGTGYLTRFLRGSVVGVDQSVEMLDIARARIPAAAFVQADVPPLPFPDDTFGLAFSSNVLSHLDTREARAALVAEALRVARELVVLEQPWQPGLVPESYEPRPLLDGTEYRVFKRYLSGEELAAELAGEIVFASPEFVAVRTIAP